MAVAARAPLLLLAVVAAALTLAPATTAHTRPTAREAALVEAINEARAAYGLRPVALGPGIADRARAYARSLIERNVFVHGRLRPGTGEVLAWGTPGLMGARAVVQRWLASPEHRVILLWPRARRVGVGLAVGRFQGYAGVRVVVARLSV